MVRTGASFFINPGAPEGRMNYIFRDAPFMGARDKQLTLRAWVRFLRRGLRWEDFTKRLYEHLHLHCSFIAHYNRLGFYETYFEKGEDTVRFLSQFDKREGCRSVEYGWQWIAGDYADLNQAMVEEGSQYIPQLKEKAQTVQQEADIAQAQALFAKHGRQLS